MYNLLLKSKVQKSQKNTKSKANPRQIMQQNHEEVEDK